jgi:hypothetical protein
MHTEAERAYMAGLVDGEGHIGITRLASQNGRGRHTLIVQVTNTHLATLRELAAEWDVAAMGVRQRGRSRAVADLKWSTDAAVRLLREIQPYLRIKREQCRVALEFAETIRPRETRTIPITIAEWEHRDRLRYAIQLLNSRTPQEPQTLKAAPEMTCQYCHAVFTGYQKRRKYCSRDCAMKAGRDAYVDRHTTTKTCPSCGKEFVSRLKQQYCSIKCGRTAQAPPVPLGTQRVTPVEDACALCGKAFIRKPGSVRIYCSRVCGAKGAWQLHKAQHPVVLA